MYQYHNYLVGKDGLLVHNACGGKLKTIVESKEATKALDKLPPSMRAKAEEAIELVHSGKPGGNQHPLVGDLKNYKAIDVKNSGKGRGGLRVIYQENINELFIHSVQDYHFK